MLSHSLKLACSILVTLSTLLSSSPYAFAVETSPTTTPPKPTPLTGGFLSMLNSTMPWCWTLTADRKKPAKTIIDYKALVSKLRDEMGMDTLVIQFSQYSQDGVNKSGWLMPPDQYTENIGNPLADILTEAKQNPNKPVKVYLGLEYNKPLNDNLGGTASMAKSLSDQTERDKDLASRLATYVDSKSLKFDGWYITTELGNWKWANDALRKTQFNKYVQDVAQGCDVAKPGLPIGISPYFNPTDHNFGPVDFANHVKDCLAGSKVSQVMLQDGIGAHPAITDKNVSDFFIALRTALPANIEVMADIELFQNTNQVADPSRVLNQLRWQKALGTKNILGFDVLNYLSPQPDTNELDASGARVLFGDAHERRALYDQLKGLVTK